MRFCICLLTAVLLAQTGAGAPIQGKFSHFITASGDKLMDGDKEFRFISFNVPALNIHEDELEFTRSNSFSLPDEYELRDVFETVRQLGGHAVRLQAIPVRRKDQGTDTPTAVEAPGKFSEELFKVLDLVLALANEYQVRVIV
ncbi:MAG: hypothetical protein WC378_15785, partial [Opitutaceae bacterium]